MYEKLFLRDVPSRKDNLKYNLSTNPANTLWTTLGFKLQYRTVMKSAQCSRVGNNVADFEYLKLALLMTLCSIFHGAYAVGIRREIHL